MDISYKKSGNKNYIVISDVDVKETDYRINMVMNNDIYGLLPISVRYVDGKVNLNYDITSMTSLENHYLRNKISGKELYDLVNSIYKMTQAMKEFLLDINNIWLDFEGIFIDKKTREIKFCYLPVKGSFFQENAREFFDEVLKYIDHNDKLAVLIAYNIEQITVGDNFSAKDLFDVAKENMELKLKLKKKYDDPIIKSCGYGRNNIDSVTFVNELTALAVTKSNSSLTFIPYSSALI